TVRSDASTARAELISGPILPSTRLRHQRPILVSTICRHSDSLDIAEGRHGFQAALQSIPWCGRAPIGWRDGIMGRGRDFRGGGKGRRSFDDEGGGERIAAMDFHQPRPVPRQPAAGEGTAVDATVKWFNPE